MMLFIKLLLAHLLGDFALQPGSWVREKEQKKYKSLKLYLHGLIHFLLILLFTMDLSLLPAALVIAGSHLMIDAMKLQFQREKNKRLWFFIDQILHLAVILGVVIFVTKPSLRWDPVAVNHLFIITTAVVFLLTPASVVIRLVLAKWAPATEIRTDKIETPALLHAGMAIGYLERLLVFVFILAGQWAAIGFLVTAKSVFRFSDLKMGQDRKLTEYILIGTLLSFGMAVVTGIATLYLLKG